MKKLALSLTLLALTLAFVPALATAEAIQASPAAEVASLAVDAQDASGVTTPTLESILPASLIEGIESGTTSLRACLPGDPYYCEDNFDCPAGCVCNALNCCSD